MAKDTIYSAPLSHVGDFTFDDEVASVFPDMIRRSVPGYASMLSVIAQCAQRYSQPNTNVYDLGCSLGAATRLLQQHSSSSCKIIAVDNSEAMISRLRESLPSSSGNASVELVLGDIREVSIANASLSVLNLTLQFLPPSERDGFVSEIAAGTNPGGALVLSEKICFEDDRQQELMTSLHHDFKKAHGYSDLEIAQKRTAIENRLIPETLERNVKRLRDAGFGTVTPWFQCFNFASIIAVK